ncbi:MAG: CBS domain-containing protein [Gammaproteobacteria bacterium]|nr:CBS domain-containing protein [Gammaproteobacteria bacterium]
MKVREIMVSDVTACSKDTDLESVALAMWDSGCGSLPVADDAGRPIGIITDRDISMALAFNHKSPREVQVGTIIDGKGVVTCTSEQTISEVLDLLAANRIRRLVVVDEAGRICGMLSLGDIVVEAAQESHGGFDEAESLLPGLISTMGKVYTSH